MTQGPQNPDPEHGQNPQHPQNPQYPQYGQPAPPPPPPTYGQQPPPYQQGQPYAAPGFAGAPPAPGAPYGVHPVTGIPYSDKSKLVAGLLQILIPLGIGRFYIGDTKMGVWQVVVTVLTCGIGALWPFIDGIIILATDSVDAQGRPLRSGA